MSVWPELLIGATGTLLGVTVTLLIAQRRLRSENVLAERTKWRDKIRSIATEIVGRGSRGQSHENWIALSLNTNPYDKQDVQLVDVAKRIEESGIKDGDLNEFSLRLARLLKHDWDRAKIEASWFPFFANRRAKRIQYNKATLDHEAPKKVDAGSSPA